MIAAIGAFDGFHKGHRVLFSKAGKMAARKRDSWGVVTFSPHPQSLLSEGRFLMLFTEKEKDFLVRKLGIPELVRLPFTRGLAELSPEEFVQCLEERYFLQGVVIGQDFRFGKARTGDAVAMTRLGHDRGWEMAVVPPVMTGSEKVSSSLIRKKVLAGDVAAADKMLGYPFFLSGSVIAGDGRGRVIGVPTANLHVPSGKAFPDRGVYSGAALYGRKAFAAAINVGHNPTFEGQRSIRVEAHLLDFDEDVYGKELSLFFFDRIRNETRFEKVEELLSRITMDVAETRKTWALRGQGLRYWLEKDGQGVSSTGSCGRGKRSGSPGLRLS